MPAEQTWPGGIVLAKLPADAGCMTLDELEAATGFSRDRLSALISLMNKNGLIRVRRAGCYSRTRDGDKAIETPRKTGGPRKGQQLSFGLTERVWRALRIMGKGTLAELLEIADAKGKSGEHTRKYLAKLVCYGLVVVSGRRRPGDARTSNGFKQYILVRNVGPIAPVWSQRKGVLFDPNSRQNLPLPTIEGGETSDV
jgi:hypothetical protein